MCVKRGLVQIYKLNITVGEKGGAACKKNKQIDTLEWLLMTFLQFFNLKCNIFVLHASNVLKLKKK